ncbi:hypothetical protein [Rhodococcus sp. LW-XY12]|uniref:hypothetical protein n=1 Tax=Rhodococcus sp. LW-XY12 TaxID=2856851 RepID=UPI001C568550|nr:hypothetical protein [Rhodococcus sp. LW-XY12]QXU55202.1 hypothetical protein KXC42_08255 [Rhodococcus sp. LW-XY12]
MTLRSEVEHELAEAGFSVAAWADNALPPAPLVIVDLGDPYLQYTPETTSTFGARWSATIVATLITGRGPDRSVAAELDSMIERAVAALLTLDHTGTIPGDGVPTAVEVRAPMLDAENIVGAQLSITYPITMKG